MGSGVVILGAGHAGVQAAASLRDEAYDGPITLVDAGHDLPYHKPPLSKAFLKDNAAQPQILRSQDFYDGARIALRLGERAVGIDLTAGRLDLASGTSLGFDELILATGSRPRRLPQLDGELQGIVSLRTLDDARMIRDLASRADDVVILGGGFIGLEVAATLAVAGRRVTVVEAQDRLLGRAVAPIIAAHVRARLQASGICILTGTMIAAFEGERGKLRAAVTSAGERIVAQMAIVGIGAVASSELAEQAGIATANGVRVDASLRSSVPNVLSIGDGASFRHWQTGTELRLESVQNATDQAKLAARTITGHDEAFTAVPWFWSDIADMKLQMVGLAAGSDRVVVSGDPADGRFSLLHFAGERLAAIESVNRPADHMLGRRMIAAGYSPDTEALMGGDLKAAFSQWEREWQDRQVAP